MKKGLLIGTLLLIGLLSACSEEKANVVASAAKIESSDQCHLCGMMIANYPGPKGELASKGEENVFKFCSTRDLFAYYLQPENTHRAVAMYVHDMAELPWGSPDDDHFIDAKTAFYVWGSSQKGAMGATLGSFAEHKHATAFAEQYGGEIYTFEDITLELISGGMNMMNQGEGHSMMGDSSASAHSSH